MAPVPPPPAEKDNSHQLLLDQLDIAPVPRSFRNPKWKPSQRRNKNIKQVLGETSRKEASTMATQNNSGASTPFPMTNTVSDGAATPVGPPSSLTRPNIAQASENLSTLVLKENARSLAATTGPTVTYTNIESAPSLHAGHKRYCDITGLHGSYSDPKTRLRYHNKEVFDVVRTLPQGMPERYLEARGAHTVLK